MLGGATQYYSLSPAPCSVLSIMLRPQQRKWLSQEVEIGCYLYDTMSFYYRNLNMVRADRMEIARKLNVSDEKTAYLLAAGCIVCSFQ